jgi:bacillithiol system protein YtxJ
MSETVLHDLGAWERSLAAHAARAAVQALAGLPVSAAARREWEAFLRERPDVTALFVDVIADRAVARGIAERCGVRHESPQAILFVAGAPAWHASHDGIMRGALDLAWVTAAAGSPGCNEGRR